MARNNSTIFDIIQSELINTGHDEFDGGLEIVFFEDDYQFIKKAMRYDKDVQNIVNDKIFQNLSLYSIEADIHFKRTFVNKFLNSQMSRQTLEDFSAKVCEVFLLHEYFINMVYSNYDNYMKGTSETKGQTKGDTQNDHRMLSSDLPRDNINLNVDDTVLDYGNINTIERDKTIDQTDENSTSNRYNVDDLLKCQSLLSVVFDQFSYHCFMRVF